MSIFGQDLPVVCARCHADELALLSRPHGPTSDVWFYERKCVVRNHCSRCFVTYLQSSPENPRDYVTDAWTTRDIILPADLISTAATISSLSEANALWEQKGQNAELQLAHNAKYHYQTNAYLSRAVKTVGLYAIREELECFPQFKQATTCEYVFASVLPFWYEMPQVRGTPWKVHVRKPDDDHLVGDWSEWAVQKTGDVSLLTINDKDTKGDDKKGKSHKSDPAEVSQGCKINDQAEVDYKVDRQKAGEPLKSKTKIGTESDCKIKNTSAIGDTGACTDEGGFPIGGRVATARFPQLTSEEQFLHDNSPENLKAAQVLRQQETFVEGDRPIGEMLLCPQEKRDMIECSNAFIRQVLRPKDTIAVALQFERFKDKLPKSMNNKMKENVYFGILNAWAQMGIIDAFIKSEVTAKDKPRVISNYGATRQALLAKVSWVFEELVFKRFKDLSIKKRSREAAVANIALNLSAVPKATWWENDLSSFDFGINPTLKKIEVAMFRAIVSALGIDEDIDAEAFERVVDERTKKTTWRMRFVDEAGEKCTYSIELPQAMRDSGDRITSSGNWVQNLLAWVEYFVDPADYDKFFVALMCKKGQPVYYKSKRTGETFEIALAFEGDDTLLATSEKLLIENIVKFFANRGWKAKLRSVTTGVATFVGSHILIKEGEVVVDAGELVICPEIKRCLNTKSWTATNVPEEDVPAISRLHAIVMASQFRKVTPMHQFWSAIAQQWTDRGASALKGGKLLARRKILSDLYMKEHGEVLQEDAVVIYARGIQPSTALESSNPVWRELAELAAGSCTNEEWSLACGITSVLGQHGDDLRAFLPQSWTA